MMVVNHVLPRFTDADGRFQFVYVKDAAHAVLRVISDEKAYGQSYNLCQDEVVTYDSFFETLKAAAKDVSDGEYQNVTAPLMTEELQEIPITVEEAEVQQIPIPFPATAAETELCSNEKSKLELGLKYTDFAEGMRRTFRAFKNVFS